MDNYPSSEDEYELLYADDLELLNELEVNVETVNKNVQVQQSHSEVGLCKSPQLSHIFMDDGYSLQKFGQPGPSKGLTSTPFEGVPKTPNQLNVLEVQTKNRKRCLEQLFGDIRDIDKDRCLPNLSNTYFDNEAKKIKLAEQKDLDLIDQILQLRRTSQDKSEKHKKDTIQYLNGIHQFKIRNLSRSIPNYTYMPLIRGSECIYVRYHSEEHHIKNIDEESHFSNQYTNILGVAKYNIWDGARELVLKSLTDRSIAGQEIQIRTHVCSGPESLLVEQYKPKRYKDLLSDESTNRSLLFWLKMWDKIVFGREFKIAQETKYNQTLSTFNRKASRFESTGGWARRKKQNLTDVDAHGGPVQKVALLCGPPGLGKTTLAHIIAKHAGYCVKELNASDDRSPEAFRLALENGTQMTSVLNAGRRPNCIILDEIDGAPPQSIEFLIKFVNGYTTKSRRGNKSTQFILQRPIICICNDIYAPSLRQLRKIAFIVQFPQLNSSRLAERLFYISKREHIDTDMRTLLALAEKTGNDIRSCLSMIQFFSVSKKKLTLLDILNANLGQKDQHKGLFGVWNTIFQIQRPRCKVVKSSDTSEENDMITVTDMSNTSRMQHILDIIGRSGGYDRLIQGIYENYLKQKMPDANMQGVVEAIEWFCFSDSMLNLINRTQNYSVYIYLQFGFVAWHFLFASLAWPKVVFPNKSVEFNQKSLTHKLVFQAFRRGLTTNALSIGEGFNILVDTVSLLKKIVSPNLRSVALQLLTPKERYDLTHTVEIMTDLGLSFIQVKTDDGTYQYQLEPDLDLLSQFQGSQNITLNYFARQIIAREVELEIMRRSAPKLTKISMDSKLPKISAKNHLQVLQPKVIRISNTKETVSKDFFGRVTRKTLALTVQEGGTNVIVKSPIWYRYKEGFNNAVRKDVVMADLL